MAENLDFLSRNGWVFWGPSVLRTPPFAHVVRNIRASRMRQSTEGVELQRAQIAEMVDEIAATGRNLIISDENIIGTMTTNLSKAGLYERARLRTRVFLRLFQGHDISSVLTVRNYTDYWSSAFAYCALKEAVPATEALVPRVLASGRGWLDVIDDVRRGQKSGRVTVVDHRAGRDPREILLPELGEEVGRRAAPFADRTQCLGGCGRGAGGNREGA